MRSATPYLAPFLFVFAACQDDGANTSRAASTAAASAARATAPPMASAPATATASTSTVSATNATATAASACPSGYRHTEEAHFCIILPEVTKPKSYSTFTAGGAEEQLYDADEDTVFLTWQDHKGHPVDVRKRLDPSKRSDEVVGHGKLAHGGAWLDTERSTGGRRVESALRTKSHVVHCLYDVPAKKADAALKTCKSLRLAK